MAALTRRQLGLSSIFAIVAVPGLIAAGALFVKQMAHPESAAEHDATRVEAHDHHEEVLGH